MSAPPREGNVVTIQVPLGRTAASSVFLVKTEGPAVRLLRLKTWHSAAPADFMPRFERLRRQLSEWDHEAFPAPLAACVDASGRPSVLSEFNQGVPIIQRVETGALDARDALACLATLLALIRSAHQRGLVHGAIISGNIIVGPRYDRAYLLDFGHASLVRPEGDDLPEAAADVAGFDRLIHTVQTLPSARSRRP
ncbi:MAG TPA: serine/threonine-protein kinase [Vicinamibacterales bacterium]|nr:serine/threonine-protein kinase [Vicinamibacterales bacterium]